MGLFSRKKKPTSIHMPPSPQSFSTVLSTPPLSPGIPYSPVFLKPQLTLRVALDPVPNRVDDEEGLFSVVLDLDADIGALKSAIHEKVGNTGIDLFKVSVPILAFRQAQQYREKFCAPVDLLTTFPAFNLDDPSQYLPSLGPTGLTGSPKDLSMLKVNDWFSDSTPAETISILVRTAPAVSKPYTFLAHFAPSELSCLSRAGPSKQCRSSPTVVSICPNSTIRDLKAALIRSSGREVADEHLEKVVMWKVEMSQDEMIVIGERGGLKGGRMPWPYPPGALVPVNLSDASLPISHYYPNHKSDSQMISISVYLPPSLTASADMARSEFGSVTPFKYPMDFSEPQPAPRRSRARPSTAPAVVVHTSDETTIGAPAFGAGSRVRPIGRLMHSAPDITSRPRRASPLSSTPVTQHGLGINLSSIPQSPPGPQDAYRGSVSVSDCSSDEGVPALCFSQISLSLDPTDITSGLRTPDAATMEEKNDWLSPNPQSEHPELRKAGSLRVMSLGSWRHRKREQGIVPVMGH